MRTTTRALALMLALASPAMGYTIYLKDGSTIISATKYEIDGERALITLPGGTKTFLRLAEIDIPRTDRENLVDYGDAKVVGEDGSVTTMTNDVPPPPKKPTLQDLVAQQRAVAPPPPEPHRRAEVQNTGPLPRTLSGSVDFSKLPGSPFHDLELAGEVARFFAGRNIEGISLYQGTENDRLLIEVTTGSEASVLNALKTAANALVQIRDSRGAAISAFELNLVNQRRQRAGQFTLTPELATELTSGSIQLTDFFVKYVEF